METMLKSPREALRSHKKSSIPPPHLDGDLRCMERLDESVYEGHRVL